ncbi:MAG: ATP-binding protein [Acidimicrobiales bacterium]
MIRLAPDAGSVRAGRHFAAGWFAGNGGPEQLESVVLVVSELVTNAVVHAKTELELRISAKPSGRIRVEVLDDDTREPRVVAAGPLAERGRGLSIVESVAIDWGVTPCQSGKLVWAEVGSR